MGCAFKKLFSKEKDFGLPVISIGNLTIGGNGKTPITMAIAKLTTKPAIVLRGYGRKSFGLVVVRNCNEILADVNISGDEAMEYALSLPDSIVIVSEDRSIGIKKAKELGAHIVLLDDGFSKFGIKKYDILLEPAVLPLNPFCLPAGPYRCPFFMKTFADLILKEDEHFKRAVEIENPTGKMLLVTSISKPSRLDPFLPDGVVDKLYFKDHDYFDKTIIDEAYRNSGATSLLVTNKDAVKLQNYSYNLSLIKLSIEFNSNVIKTIKSLDGIKLALFESER